MIVISLEMVRVFASMRLGAALRSAPNLAAKAVGSTLASRSARASASARRRRLRRRPGPTMVETVAASRKRPWIAPTYFGPGERWSESDRQTQVSIGVVLLVNSRRICKLFYTIADDLRKDKFQMKNTTCSKYIDSCYLIKNAF